MAEGTNVGTISLDLIIRNTLGKQLDAIARKTESSAGKSFAGVGESVSKAIQRPLETAGAAIKKPLNEMRAEVKEAADDLDAIVARANEKYQKGAQVRTHEGEQPEVVEAPKTRLAFEMAKEPITRQAAEMNRELSEVAQKAADLKYTFIAAVDPVGLLNQKLDNVNAQIGIQQEKLKSLSAEYARTLDVKDAKGIRELEAQMTAVEGKLISLQSTAAQTGAKLQKALNPKTTGAGKELDRLQSKVKSATDTAEKTVSGGLERMKAKSGQALGNIQNGVNKLGKTVKSVFKATFLTAGLYAAFRGIKSLMEGAMSQSAEFSKALNSVKANLSVAFQPIMQAVMPALTALMNGLASVSKQIAAFLSGLFGRTYAQSAAAAKKLQSVQKGAKAAASQMSSLDELNVISKDSGGEEEGTDFSGLNDEGTKEAESFAQKFKSFMADIGFDDVKKRFETFLVDIERQIKQHDFGKAFQGALANGAKLIASALQLGEGIAFPIVVALDIPGIVFESLNLLSALFATLDQVVRALTPGIENFVQIALVPIATWIGGVIKDALSFLSGQLEKIGAWFADHQEMFNKLGESLGELVARAWEFLEPLASTVWQVFKDVLAKIVEVVLQLGEKFGELIGKFIEAGNEIWAFLDSIGVLDTIREIIQITLANLGVAFQTIVDIIGGVLDGIITALGGLIDFIVGVFTGDWTRAWNGIKTFFGGIWDAICSIFTGVWDSIKKAWNTFSEWFQPIWEGLWKGIGNFFINIWNSILGAFESCINWIIGGINDVIDAINLLLSGGEKLLKKFGLDVEFSVPNIPRVSLGRVPLLASGGLITQPTLGMIGEYPGAASNPEIVSPEDRIRKIVREEGGGSVALLDAMREQNGLLRAILEKETVMELDGDTVGRFVKSWESKQGVQVSKGAFAFSY